MKLSILFLFKFLFLFTPVQTDVVPASIYDIKAEALTGKEIDFAAYKGKKILIVNVPCNTTIDRQYGELDALYKKYKDKLVVIGFLADDFAIAPGTKIRNVDYRKMHYNVSFPLAAKVLVKGKDKAPIYKWLTDKQYNELKDSEVKWDFQKYLVDENGHLVAVFDPKVRTTDPRIITAIEKQ